MSSIVAVLGRTGAPDPAAVPRMVAASPHRGVLSELRSHGHAIVAVSNIADSSQASVSVSDDLTAAVAGTFDNVAALACELTRAGFPPASSRAADVVVSAFRAFGTEAPNRMRGVFAGVVTDGRHLWLFRDHLGFQPLFYADCPRGLVVATEVKQVIAGAEISPEPNLAVLEQVFYGRLKQNSPSPYKGVSRVPHATTVTVNARQPPVFQPYWHPRRVLETGGQASFEEVKQGFDAVFERAVSRCLTGADVIALSGGVDSPAVAGYAAPVHRATSRGTLGALSLVFPDHPKVDERPYIERVTQELGIPLHTFVSRARIHDDLLHWIRIFDGPIPNITAPQLYEFYSEARRLGYRNILTGDIAEVVVDLPLHVHGHLLMRGRLRPLARLMATQWRQGASLRRFSTWKTFASQLIVPFVPGRIATRYYSWRDGSVHKRLPEWIDYQKASEVPYRNDLLAPGRARWSEVQVGPLEGCPISMEALNTCATTAGVTVRRPFADVDVWEYFLGLPAEIKYPDLKSKTLLRRVLRGQVPDVILDRRDKTYFDDHITSQINYPVLEQFLLKPAYRMSGVDYDGLALRLERRDLRLIDLMWIGDLLEIHAFVSQW